MQYLFLLASAAAHTGESVFTKLHSRKNTGVYFTFVGVKCLFAMIFFILACKGSYFFPPEMFGYALVAGILYLSASLLTNVAISCGPYAISNLTLSFSSIITILYGLIWLKEPSSVFTYAGFAILVVSLVLVKGKAGKDNNGFSIKWLVSIIISFFSSGLFGVAVRMQQIRFENRCSNEFMMICLLLSAAVLITIGVIREKTSLRVFLRSGVLYAAGGGLSNGLTNLLSLFVTMYIPVSIASPMGVGLRMIFTYLLGRFAFRERFQRRQTVGIALGTIALILMNL